MAKEIEITINPDGTSEIEMIGFDGKGCAKILDDIVQGVGGTVLKRSKKCEFYKPEVKEKVKQKIQH